MEFSLEAVGDVIKETVTDLIGYGMTVTGYGLQFIGDPRGTLVKVGNNMVDDGNRILTRDNNQNQIHDNTYPGAGDYIAEWYRNKFKKDAQQAVYDYRRILVEKRDFDNNDETYDLFELIRNRNELAKNIKEQYPTITRHSSLDSFATAMRESNVEFEAEEIIALICFYRTI